MTGPTMKSAGLLLIIESRGSKLQAGPPMRATCTAAYIQAYWYLIHHRICSTAQSSVQAHADWKADPAAFAEFPFEVLRP